MFKRLLYRFVRGFATGAGGAMSGVSIVAPAHLSRYFVCLEDAIKVEIQKKNSESK